MTHMTAFISARRAALVLCIAALAACSAEGTDKTGVRTGSQAVHPGAEAAPKRTYLSPNRLSPAVAAKKANALFDRYCLSGKSNASIANTLRGSSKFRDAKVIRAGDATFTFYPLADGTRGGITLVKNSIGGLRCSVGIENVGPNLYENGRITRPKV